MGELREDIVYYRAKERITQEELGKRCGLTGQTIMNIENGNANPNKTTVAKIRLVIDKKEEE